MKGGYTNALIGATADELERLIDELAAYGQNRQQALRVIKVAVEKVGQVPKEEEPSEPVFPIST